MLKTKMAVALATMVTGSTGIAHSMPNQVKAPTAMVQSVGENSKVNSFAVNTMNTINFDGVHSTQHFKFASDLYPNFQSSMYTSGKYPAYCLDNGFFGADKSTSYKGTNDSITPETYTILANGYNGSQASLDNMTKETGVKFTKVMGYEATQLAIWASNNANESCRVDLGKLYSSNAQGKAIVEVARQLFKIAENATATLNIEGDTSSVKYINGSGYIGPLKIKTGEPVSSYTVKLSGDANDSVVAAIGGKNISTFKSGQAFYIKVDPSNKTTNLKLSINAMTTLNDGVIQSSGEKYYQNYVNQTTKGFVSLNNSIDIKIPAHIVQKPVVKHPSKPVVVNNTNKQAQTQSQHQEQHQSSVNNNNVSPKIIVSPNIKITINNENSNSNTNTNTNNNENSNTNTTGSKVVKAGSTIKSSKTTSSDTKKSDIKNSKSVSNSNVNKNDNSNTNTNSNGSETTNTVASTGTSANNSAQNTNVNTQSSVATPASNIVQGQTTQGLPFTGVTPAKAHTNADNNILIALGGILAAVLGVFGIRKFK